jgi:hypothetical protein
VCLDVAIDGHCTDKQCWRKHDAESIEQYKAALGMKRWEKKKQWWKRIRAGQKPSTPKADDTDEAKVDTDKTEIDKGSERKGAKKGGMYMLYGDSARGQGGSHLTLTVRAPHARMTQALAGFKRACGAVGRAAVNMAEHIDTVISSRIGVSNKPLKDVPMKQSTEQPTDVPIEQPTDVPTQPPKDVPMEQPTEQPAEVPTQPPKDVPTTDMPLEQPTEVPTEQPTDMPTDKPKEQSMDMHYGEVKPNVSEIATLEGLVFKDIILESGYKQTERTSVATSRWRRARTPCGSVRTHRSI